MRNSNAKRRRREARKRQRVRKDLFPDSLDRRPASTKWHILLPAKRAGKGSSARGSIPLLPLDHCVNRCAETSPRPEASFTYRSCGSTNLARTARIKITGRILDNAARVQLSISPSDAFATILIERSKAAVKLRPLRGGQGKVIVFQAVPKLRD